jgi:hypothetical protein
MDGEKGPYDIEEKLNDRFRDSCKNTKLLEKGAFTVTKFKPDTNRWVFQAIVEKKVLSRFIAEEDGECNDVRTFEGSYHCGLATALMEFCFTDPDVGTMDPNDNVYFKSNSAEHSRNLAIENCDHIVYLVCGPSLPATHGSCSAYMTAAMNTGHTMMFTYHPYVTATEKPKWEVLKIATAKHKIKSNAVNFVEEYGSQWFFCECKAKKSNNVKKCN